MRHEFFTDIGGFIWWLFKVRKTNLVDEQKKENWSRNLFTVIVLLLIISFISIKITT